MDCMLEHELVKAREAGSGKLVVVLHGLGDSMEGYRWFPEMMRLPWLNVMLVNAPDEYFGGYSWYDFAGNAESGVVRSRQMLMELLDHCREQEGFASEDTVLFGFSQGCLMTVDVGLRYGHRLGGLVGVSGYVHRPEALLANLSEYASEVPVLITHGTLDPLVPFEPARGQFEQLKEAGVKLEWQAFQKVHTIDGERELGVIRNFVERALSAKR
jgi:phospholipase/carboxylesterase